MQQFFVTLFAYIAATVCGVVFAEHSSAPLLGAHIVASVRTTCDLIPTSLSTILDGPASEVTDSPRSDSVPSPSPGTTQHALSTLAPSAGVSEKALEEQMPIGARTRQQRLARSLRSQVAAMRAAFKAYSLDIVHARHAPGDLQPIISVFGRLQRNALLMPTGHVPGERIRNALERAYATPLSPAASRRTSRSSSRHATPRRYVSTVFTEIEPGTPTAPTMPMGVVPAFHLQPPPLAKEIPAAHLARELSKVATHSHPGSRIPSGTHHDHQDTARRKLTTTCGHLSDAIVAALYGASALLTEACDWHWREGECPPLPSVDELQAQLDGALADLQKRLSGILDSAELPPLSPGDRVVFEDQMTSDWLDDEDRFRIAFFMIALLDLARDTRSLLQQAGALHSSSSPKKWYLPALDWPWTPLPSDAQLPSSESTLLWLLLPPSAFISSPPPSSSHLSSGHLSFLLFLPHGLAHHLLFAPHRHELTPSR